MFKFLRTILGLKRLSKEERLRLISLTIEREYGIYKYKHKRKYIKIKDVEEIAKIIANYLIKYV